MRSNVRTKGPAFLERIRLHRSNKVVMAAFPRTRCETSRRGHRGDDVIEAESIYGAPGQLRRRKWIGDAADDSMVFRHGQMSAHMTDEGGNLVRQFLGRRRDRDEYAYLVSRP